MNIRISVERTAIMFLLLSMSLPANASLITYSFFSFLSGKGNAVASGMLTYNTQQESFIEADIFTTPGFDRQGNLLHPGGRYTRVNLLRDPDHPSVRPFSVSVWGEHATGSLFEPMISMLFFPWAGGNLDRLEILSGAEGLCMRTRNVNGCLVSNDRIMYISAGRALAIETKPLDEPSSLALMLAGLMLTAAAARQRSFSESTRRTDFARILLPAARSLPSPRLQAAP